MLGLADKGARRRMLGQLLDGDGPALLTSLDEHYSLGIEPLALMRALLDIVHRITVAQVAGEADAPAADERAELLEWAQRLTPPELHRLWQLLLKGYEEVRQAPDGLAAARMALLRALHAAQLPDPGALAKKLEALAAAPSPDSPVTTAPATGSEPQSLDFTALVRDVERRGHALAASIMKLQLRPVSVHQGLLRFSRPQGFGDDVGAVLRDALRDTTGQRWILEELPDGGEPTLVEREEADRTAQADRTRAHPLVAATLAAFPEAELIESADTASPGARKWRRES
jgi:DNA polymerase III subunit gamma/tau